MADAVITIDVKPDDAVHVSRVSTGRIAVSFGDFDSVTLMDQDAAERLHASLGQIIAVRLTPSLQAVGAKP